MILHVAAKAFERFKIEDKKFFVLPFQNSLFVIEDKCYHRGGPLSLGTYDADKGVLTCPMHELKSCSKSLVKSALPTVRVGDFLHVVTPG